MCGREENNSDDQFTCSVQVTRPNTTEWSSSFSRLHFQFTLLSTAITAYDCNQLSVMQLAPRQTRYIFLSSTDKAEHTVIWYFCVAPFSRSVLSTASCLYSPGAGHLEPSTPCDAVWPGAHALQYPETFRFVETFRLWINVKVRRVESKQVTERAFAHSLLWQWPKTLEIGIIGYLLLLYLVLQSCVTLLCRLSSLVCEVVKLPDIKATHSMRSRGQMLGGTYYTF